MKRITLFISLAILSVLIVACNGGGGNNNNANVNTNSPESVARTVFSAMVDFNFDAVLPHVCPERRAEFQQQFDELAPLIEAQAEAIAQLTIDMSKVTYTVTNQTDTSAEVLIAGEVTINDGETTFTEDVMTTENDPMRLTKVGDTWYICSDVL